MVTWLDGNKSWIVMKGHSFWAPLDFCFPLWLSSREILLHILQARRTNSELFSLESRAYWETRKAFCGFIWLGRRRLEPGVWEGRLNRKRKRQRCFFPSVAHRKGRLKANHNLCTYRKLVQLKCQQPEKSLTLAWHKSQRPRNPCPSLGKGVCTQIQDAEWRVVVGHWQQDDD